MAADLNQIGDKRGCWQVAVACFWTNFFAVGFGRSGPVIFVALIDYFQITREDAAWPTGVYGLFFGLSGVISGYLTIYFSIRSVLVISALITTVAVSLCSLSTSMWHINVLFGFFQGIGTGPISSLVQAIVPRYFVRHRTSAMGICTAGIATGGIIWPRVTHWLLEEFGLHGTFLLLGGIILNSLVGIAFLKDPDDESATAKALTVDVHGNTQSSSKVEADPSSVELQSIGQSATNTEGIENKSNSSREITLFREAFHHTLQILTNIDACSIMLVYTITYSICRVYLLVIIDFAEERSVPVERGVYLVSVNCFCELFARLTFGWVIDKKWVTRKSMVCLLLFFHGILVVSLSFCYSYESLIGVFVFVGFVYGCTMINQIPLFAEAVDRHLVPLTAGMNVFLIGISMFLSPALIGCFKDGYQSYRLMFIWFGVIQLAVVGLWMLATSIRKWIVHHKEVAHSTNNERKDTVS